MHHLNNLTLVDDDPIYTFLTQKTIEGTKLVSNFKIFSNGLDCLTSLKANINQPDLLPDLILLDLSMPIMDGWEFLEEFANLHLPIGKKITIYICTSSITPADQLKAQQISEVSDFIIKPITAEKFHEIVRSL